MTPGVRCWLLTMFLVDFSCIPAQTPDSALEAARIGRVDTAVVMLKAAPRSAQSDELLCNLYASVEQRDAAVSACESAVAQAPSSSSYALELARAYGEKASHGGPIAGMRLVGKIRGNFERAVQLDSKNVEAVSDLGQFYVEAPGIAGGGLNKARALVLGLQALSPARSHRLAGMIAAKAKDYTLAGQEFQAELALFHSPEAYVDLANFYSGLKDWDKAAATAGLAIEHDTHHGPDTLDAASLLINLKRDLPLAQTALYAYISTPQQNVASYAKAHVLLARSHSASGNAAAAQAEYKAALLLAKDYQAAKQGLS